MRRENSGGDVDGLGLRGKLQIDLEQKINPLTIKVFCFFDGF